MFDKPHFQKSNTWPSFQLCLEYIKIVLQRNIYPIQFIDKFPRSVHNNTVSTGNNDRKPEINTLYYKLSFTGRFSIKYKQNIML